jgi:hypothetical protein
MRTPMHVFLKSSIWETSVTQAVGEEGKKRGKKGKFLTDLAIFSGKQGGCSAIFYDFLQCEGGGKGEKRKKKGGGRGKGRRKGEANQGCVF